MRFFANLAALLFGICFSTPFIYAAQKPIINQKNLEQMNTKNIHTHLARFVKVPHPMGSHEQLIYAQELASLLKSSGFKVKHEEFEAFVPNRSKTTPSPSHKSLRAVKGYNVLAVRKGTEKECGILLGSHYDTKFFPEFSFVGANDGGSSTALLLELARILPAQSFAPQTWGACSVFVALFDGEEAVLPEWNDGTRELGVTDHLYGSRMLAASLKAKQGKYELRGTPLNLVVILDMVGHKQQKLIVSQGSDANATQTLLSQKGPVDIHAEANPIEDDHVPFAQLGIPYVHVIDWTNLNEWHTQKDNLDIISDEKIAEAGDMILRFLHQPRK